MSIEKQGTSAVNTQERLPYPANALGEPKKAFGDTFKLSTAVQKAIEKNK